MTHNKDLSDIKLDCLKEVSTVGFGDAAKTLSALIAEKVVINVSKITVDVLDKLHNSLKKIVPFIIAIKLEILGDINGNIVIFFSRESALRLVNILKIEERETISVEMIYTIMMDISSILSKSYLSAITRMTYMNTTISVPQLVVNAPDETIDEALIKINKKYEHAIAIEPILEVKNQKLQLYFLFLGKFNKLNVILKSLENVFRTKSS